MSTSRVEKLAKNSAVNILCHTLQIIIKFIIRTAIINTLSVEYWGINGVFTSVLTVLSLSELGIGGAIIYSLYKPFAEKSYNKICAYNNIFKKLYFVIGLIVTVLGICLLPFLNIIVKDAPNIANLKLIYLLFVFDSSSSYFFAHYRSLLTADQKEYISTVNTLEFTIIQMILQIGVLFFWHDFCLYLIIQICIKFLSGYFLSVKVKKTYSFLNDKSENKLEKNELITLIKNSLAVFSHKIGFTILNSSDNIVLSAFIGSIWVGVYSNYLLLITAISGILALLSSAFEATVGNICASADKKSINKLLNNINFIYFWIYGVCFICLYNLSTPFVSIWAGSGNIIADNIIIIVYINFFLQGVRRVLTMFTTVLGLFYNMRFKPIFEVLINLGVSIFLAYKIGAMGVFIGTVISFVLTNLWYEPYTLFKYIGFGRKEYYLKCILYTAVTIIIFVLVTLCCNTFKEYTWITLFIRLIICILLPNLTYFILYRKTEAYQYAKDKFTALVKTKLAH